jgi:hypothetical protein
MRLVCVTDTAKLWDAFGLVTLGTQSNFKLGTIITAS